MKTYQDITLLTTHYNRSQSLERLLKSFKSLDISFGEIVISDDGSQPEHVERLETISEEYGARLVLSDTNRGLANNMNKGQREVKRPYTLYVQEDFNPKPEFKEALESAFKFMEEDTTLDIVRFYNYWRYPHYIPLSNGFALMNFNLWLKGYRKFYAYSDHPHLRRSSFCEKFGPYKECKHSDQTEYKMMMSFLKKGGKGLFYINHQDLFDHDNSDEPSTVERNSLRNSKNPLITLMRDMYRHIKFNLDYILGRS